MLKANLNELAALQFVTEFISISDLINAAMNGFSEESNTRAKDSADICSKALKAFLE